MIAGHTHAFTDVLYDNKDGTELRCQCGARLWEPPMTDTSDSSTLKPPACPGQCDQNREANMVVVERKPDGTPSVWCDPCIADIITALNAGGVRTIASCCGHQQRPGRIALTDGRELMLMQPGDDVNRASAVPQANALLAVAREPPRLHPSLSLVLSRMPQVRPRSVGFGLIGR